MLSLKLERAMEQEIYDVLLNFPSCSSLLSVRPLRVKLLGENRPLSADNTYELWCEVAGAKPAPTITWWKGSMPMRNTRELVIINFIL